MARNPSFGSSSSTKPRCPNCGNSMSLTCSHCFQCGFSQFFKRGSSSRKVRCNTCAGDGKGRWYYEKSDHPGYCTQCSGRGYIIEYSLIDLRVNQVTTTLSDSYGSRVFDVPAVKPVYRGTIRGSYGLISSVIEFVGGIVLICISAWGLVVLSAIVYFLFLVFKFFFLTQ